MLRSLRGAWERVRRGVSSLRSRLKEATKAEVKSIWGKLSKGLRSLREKLSGYEIEFEDPDDAIYSLSYSGESFTDSIKLLRRSLKRKGLKRLRLLMASLPFLSELTAGLALIGGIAIVIRIAQKYLSSKGSESEKVSLEDKLEDTWVVADGVYFTSYGVSEMEGLKSGLEAIGVSSNAVEEVADTIGGITGLISGPAELALSAIDLKEIKNKESKDEKLENLVDAISYGGWGIGDLSDGLLTLLEITKGLSLASLEALGAISYGIAGVADGILGGFELLDGLREKRKRLIVRGLAEMISGFAFTLSAVLPPPFSIGALVAVGLAEAVNLATYVKLRRVEKQQR